MRGFANKLDLFPGHDDVVCVCVCARSRVSVCQCVCLRARARYLAESTSARISEALIGCELGTAVLHVPIGSV